MLDAANDGTAELMAHARLCARETAVNLPSDFLSDAEATMMRPSAMLAYHAACEQLGRPFADDQAELYVQEFLRSWRSARADRLFGPGDYLDRGRHRR